ncbi:MAG TPA: anti-sigma regulatory factor [Acidimicrobiales bacterium]|nr:anti-sigma regulatory factor [Acidimicrobiales bacterium]
MTIIDDANDHAWFRVEDLAVAGSVRREASRLAERLGFDAERVGEVGIVATELATNLVKHAAQGAVIIRVVRSEEIAGLQLLAIDTGPGMADPRQSAEDGRSTSGSLGIGLGAVSRLASAVDGYSLPGRGTILLATLWPRTPTPPLPPRAAALTRPGRE